MPCEELRRIMCEVRAGRKAEATLSPPPEITGDLALGRRYGVDSRRFSDDRVHFVAVRAPLAGGAPIASGPE